MKNTRRLSAWLTLLLCSFILVSPSISEAALGDVCSVENTDPACDPCNGEICHNFGNEQEPDLRCGTVQISGFVGNTPTFLYNLIPSYAGPQCPGGQLLNIARNATQQPGGPFPGCWNECIPTQIETQREAEGYFDFLGVTCEANPTYCQDISGGVESSACRIGSCTEIPDFDESNPSGCEYELIPDGENADCALCTNAEEIGIPPCGNGICEAGLGENCASCAEDCLLPGFEDACPLTSGEVIEDACSLLGGPKKVAFEEGPPYNTTHLQCEDGDLCTDNACSADGLTCESTPKSCSGDAADFCCPSGCQAADDVDCYVPGECVEPSPTPTPTSIPFQLNGTGCSLHPMR